MESRVYSRLPSFSLLFWKHQYNELLKQHFQLPEGVPMLVGGYMVNCVAKFAVVSPKLGLL
jgi:hypothetical protein